MRNKLHTKKLPPSEDTTEVYHTFRGLSTDFERKLGNFGKFAEGVFDMTASPVQGGALLPSALRAATSLPEGGKGGTAPSDSLCKTENAPVPSAPSLRELSSEARLRESQHKKRAPARAGAPFRSQLIKLFYPIIPEEAALRTEPAPERQSTHRRYKDRSRSSLPLRQP